MLERFDSVGDLAVLVVAICRVLLFILTAEITVRYTAWYRISRKYTDVVVMNELMYGIAWAAASFWGFALLALLLARIPRGPLFLGWYVVCDAALTYAMFKHLIPAWRLSSRWKGRVKTCIGIRVGFAIVVAIALVVLDLQ